jgi:hypothetical protein
VSVEWLIWCQLHQLVAPHYGRPVAGDHAQRR